MLSKYMSPFEGEAGAVARGSNRITSLTCNVLAGELVPIPTFPVEVIFILMDGVEPVTKRISLLRSDVDCKIKLPELKKGY
jgi:hypothetical protein